MELPKTTQKHINVLLTVSILRLTCILSLFLFSFPGFLKAQQLPHVTPPAPYAVKVTQPDGSTLEVIARGDALHNWMETTDGYTVLKTARGTYEFAEMVRGKLKGSGVLAKNPNQRTSTHFNKLNQINKGLQPPLSKKESRELLQPTPLSNAKAKLSAAGVMPSKGNIKVLAILIEYPDLEHEYEKETFETFFNGPSSKPTFKSYYQQNSHNTFNPTVEVAGWYMAKNEHDYYGEQHGKTRARELVDEAIAAAEADGIDFSDYDNNGDSDVDGVIIVHAGQGAEEGSQEEYIWSHRWKISPKFLDDTFVKDYTIQPEVRVRHDGLVRVGVFCHEFGHLLGLPDLYDTDESDDKHNGIGEWGLMGTGGWVGNEEYPAGMTAFSKERLGWGNVQDITGKGDSYELAAAHSSGQIYKIKTQNANEYFLLENRQRAGTDEYLKGAGLAIWHINTEQTNKYPGSIHVNNRVDHKGVDLEEADGKNDLDFRRNRGDDGDFFPGSTKRISFNGASDPNSNTDEDQGKGKVTDIAIENIALSGTTISFDYNKKEDTRGSNCEEAVAAKEGDNSLPKTAYWYTFTLPKDGKVVISDANAVVYRKCEDGTSLASSTNNTLETGRLKKGETVRIKFGENQPKSLPLTWKLSVDDSKASPSLNVEAVADKTYGDESFSLKASSDSDGTMVYSKVSGPVEVEGTKVSITGVGVAKIKVTTAETDAYMAMEKEVSFTIAKASQSITFTEIADLVFEEGKEIPLQVKSSEELPVSVKVESGGVELKDNTLRVKKAGKVTVVASQAGNENYKSASATQTFEITKASQRITFAKIEARTYGDDPFTLQASSSQNFEVSYKVVKGKVSLDGDKVSIEGASPVEIEAYNTGNENYKAASATQTFTINKASQTLSFQPIGNVVYGANKEVSLQAQSSTALPVSFEIVDGAGEVDEAVFRIAKAGIVTLVATQGGNENYQAAQSVERTFEVQKAPQIITFTEIESKQPGDEPFLLEASSNIELPVSFRLIRGNASLDGSTLTLTGSGEVVVEAYNNGNENYQSEQVEQSFVVAEPGKLAQAITLGDLPDTVKVNEKVALDITVDSELNPDIEVIGTAVREGQQITFTQAGEVTVKVGHPGNEQYNPAATVSHTFVVITEPVVEVPLGVTEQTLSFEPVENQTFGVAPFSIGMQSSSGLSLTYEVEGPAEMSGDMVTVTGAGEVTIRAYQTGNDEFAPSDTVMVTFEVAKAPQTLSLDVIPISNNTYRLEASSDSGLPVTLQVSEGTATIEGDILTVPQSGTVTIAAVQEGNENYEAAQPVSRVVEAEVITALDDGLPASGLRIFPNPSSGVFQIKASYDGQEIPYEIYDLYGAQVQKGSLSVAQSSIDLTEHTTGTYMIQIQTRKGLERYRIIKQ